MFRQRKDNENDGDNGSQKKKGNKFSFIHRVCH